MGQSGDLKPQTGQWTASWRHGSTRHLLDWEMSGKSALIHWRWSTRYHHSPFPEIEPESPVKTYMRKCIPHLTNGKKKKKKKSLGKKTQKHPHNFQNNKIWGLHLSRLNCNKGVKASVECSFFYHIMLDNPHSQQSCIMGDRYCPHFVPWKTKT